jgi:PknH-like extracellular domain
MRSRSATIVVVSACVLLGGCAAAPTDDRPVVRIAEAAKPSPHRALGQVLPTADELAVVVGAGGMMGQLVEGGPDMLLAGVGVSEATPAECVSPTYRLQRVVYGPGPVQAVASQSWAGGALDQAPITGFFGVVQFATPDDAQAFFAASADKWHRCNGQKLVLHQSEHGAQGASKITDVNVDSSTVSAVVISDGGSTAQRALGVAADCIVDVEISGSAAGDDGARAAVDVANLMVRKISGS